MNIGKECASCLRAESGAFSPRDPSILVAFLRLVTRPHAHTPHMYTHTLFCLVVCAALVAAQQQDSYNTNATASYDQKYGGEQHYYDAPSYNTTDSYNETNNEYDGNDAPSYRAQSDYAVPSPSYGNNDEYNTPSSSYGSEEYGGAPSYGDDYGRAYSGGYGHQHHRHYGTSHGHNDYGSSCSDSDSDASSSSSCSSDASDSDTGSDSDHEEYGYDGEKWPIAPAPASADNNYDDDSHPAASAPLASDGATMTPSPVAAPSPETQPKLVRRGRFVEFGDVEARPSGPRPPVAGTFVRRRAYSSSSSGYGSDDAYDYHKSYGYAGY